MSWWQGHDLGCLHSVSKDEHGNIINVYKWYVNKSVPHNVNLLLDVYMLSGFGAWLVDWSVSNYCFFFYPGALCIRNIVLKEKKVAQIYCKYRILYV